MSVNRTKKQCNCGCVSTDYSDHGLQCPFYLAGKSARTARTKEKQVIIRIREAHQTLIEIAGDLRFMDDFDHAQDMSDAAMFCRAAANDLRDGKSTREKSIRRRDKA